MVRVSVVELVLPPPVPVMVMVLVPVVAPWFTLICMVDVPEPGAAITVGEKVTTT